MIELTLDGNMKYPWEKNIGKPSRYLPSDKVGSMEATLVVIPPGYCNWCGKPVPRKNRRFCPGVITHEYTSTDRHGKKHVHRTRRYDCYNAFFVYWVRIPRFKRAVFLRDNFTCKACGARSLWTNKHGIEFPDVGQLACDHIIPYSKGGKTELSNLQTLCRLCNGKKGDKIDWKLEGKLTLDEWLQIWKDEKTAKGHLNE